MSEKYYLIRVEDLSWGTIERKIDDLKIAKLEYSRLKLKFKNVLCSVVLLSVDSNEDDYQEKIVYKKTLGTDSVQDVLHEMAGLIEKFRNICQTNSSMIREHGFGPGEERNGNAQNIYHGVELLRFSNTTGEERDQILYNLEESLAIRRAAKDQMTFAKSCNGNMKNILNAIKSCNGDINKKLKDTKEYNESDAAKVKNSKYFRALGLNYEEFYPELFEDELEDVDRMIEETEICNDNDDDSRYMEYEDIYEDLYA